MGRKPPVVWAPHPGAQRKFMTCPTWECLLHGNRGGGKTDVLLMDFAQGVGRGWGEDYRGLILREATTELGDVIAKSRKWFPRMFPGSKYNRSRKIWEFPDGETLWFNYARVLDDYEQYHGHEYAFIGWEELTNHPLPEIYLKLMSCSRCSNKDVIIKYRATCNPSGPGHQWVKNRFIDIIAPGKVFTEKIEVEVPDKNGALVKEILHVTRTHVRSLLSENKAMAEADPLYQAKIMQMTEGNDMLRKAWLLGDWDLLIGGFFTDVWDPKVHILDPFEIPRGWHISRSFDWGSSKPWSVTYGFETNGEQPTNRRDTRIPNIPRGSMIIVAELYGWTGTPNEGDRATSSDIADRVVGMDGFLEYEYGVKVIDGPADTQIWEVRDGSSIAKNLSSHGVRWTRAYKGSGSRIAGWSLIRQMLSAAKRKDPEAPHLYFFPKAVNHIRTLPLMQRDSRNPEDIDTDLEDHAMDSLRYLLSRKILTMKHRKMRV